MNLTRNKKGKIFIDDFYAVVASYDQYYCYICLDTGTITPEYAEESRVCGNCIGKEKVLERIYFKTKMYMYEGFEFVVGYKKTLL